MASNHYINVNKFNNKLQGAIGENGELIRERGLMQVGLSV